MCLWSPQAAHRIPGGVLSSSVFYYLYHALPCSSLFIYLQAVFSPLITPSYPSSNHHYSSRCTSVFFIFETCQRGPNIIATCASVHSGRRAGPRFACVSVQIRRGAHRSGTRERRRQWLLSCTATHCVCKEPLSLLAERRYALLTSGEGKTYGHIRPLSANSATPPPSPPHTPSPAARPSAADASVCGTEGAKRGSICTCGKWVSEKIGSLVFGAGRSKAEAEALRVLETLKVSHERSKEDVLVYSI